MKKILFGTTNPAKRDRLRAIVKDLPIEILCLTDLNIDVDVEEDGKSPEENAIKKAKSYYALSNIPTFSIDAGLYIDKFPEEKQPGVFVRRIVSPKATDEEMIEYYIDELNKVGGSSPGKWVVSIAMVSDDEVCTESYFDESLFTADRSPIFRKGEPLASLQIDPTLKKYKSEITPEERSMLAGQLDKDLYQFFVKHVIS